MPDGTPRVPDRLRLHRPRGWSSRQATVAARCHPARTRCQSRISTPRFMARLAGTRDRRPHLAGAGRGRRRHSVHRSKPRSREYRPEIAQRLWEILLIADMALKRFRGDFLGKTSPAHFFWGSFDLAMTRFSGRRAPEHPGGVPNLADWVTREAYSHEVWSAGFWPGTAGAFERPGLLRLRISRAAGFRGRARSIRLLPTVRRFREFLLPYDAVRELVRSSGCGACLSAEHLRGSRRSRRVAARGARAAALTRSTSLHFATACIAATCTTLLAGAAVVCG